ncbi:MAG: hypothetical protein H8E43_10660 [Planctomycetia bacterium]|nr:hypothetical protein [Planctomycetia bacterium]MBL6914907.1 hypothetical protein [Planctomycetota bacterium]
MMDIKVRSERKGTRLAMGTWIRISWLVTILLGAWIAESPTCVAQMAPIQGFLRGDINGDQFIDLSDPVLLLEEIFGSGTGLPCESSADINIDGSLQLDDVITLLGFVFSGSPHALPAPFPNCDLDINPTVLTCMEPPCSLGEVTETRQLTLSTFRESLPYIDQLPQFRHPEIRWETGNSAGLISESVAYSGYGIVPGDNLPGDLSLDTRWGTLSATNIPAGIHEFDLFAKAPNAELVFYKCRLAAFEDSESQIQPAPNLNIPGQHSVSVLETFFEFTHDLPWPPPYPLWSCNSSPPPSSQITDLKPLRILIPEGLSGPAPILIFHHGTGFDWDDYDSLLGFVATHGVICVSVGNTFSFEVYTDWYCWGGHDAAAGVLLRTREVVEAMSQDSTSPLFDLIDVHRVFYGGHSRGASAAVTAAELEPNTPGLILLQPTDAKQDSWIGNTTRWQTLPDVPILSVTAEQDTDVIYPYAERLLERMVGATTAVCIYGGCHGYSSNSSSLGCGTCTWIPQSPAVDSCPYISRSLQHDLTRKWMLAFLNRYAFDDISMEGLLYGTESQLSQYESVATKRNLSGVIEIDNFDQFPFNSQGFEISHTNMILFNSGPCYDWPFPLPQPIPEITNLICILPPQGDSSINMPLGFIFAPMSLGSQKNLKFRIKNHDVHGGLDNIGWHFTATLSLRDSSTQTATLNLMNYLPENGNHPQSISASPVVPLKYQRFLDVTIPLEDFLNVNPNLNFNSLGMLDWVFTTDGTAPFDIRLGIDDLRIE